MSETSDSQARADWQLPPGVSRSLWEFAHDRSIARDEQPHLAGSPLLKMDQQLVEQWLPEPGRVADLGCGTGRIALSLARRGFEVLGVDLSCESLQVALEKAEGEGLRLSAIEGNLCELDCIADQSCDVALLMFATLGMVSGRENRAQILTHAARILKPGGRLVLHAHSIWSQRIARAGRWWILRDLWRRLIGSTSAGDTFQDYRGIPGMYHHLFTRGELLGLLKQSGFKPVDVVTLIPEGESGLRVERRARDTQAVGWIILAAT